MLQYQDLLEPPADNAKKQVVPKYLRGGLQVCRRCSNSGLLWLQVQALGGVPCRAGIMQRPAPLLPAQVTSLLHPNVSDAVRTAALLAAWVSGGVRWAVGAVDRQNATGTQDDLKVGRLMRIRLDIGSMCTLMLGSCSLIHAVTIYQSPDTNIPCSQKWPEAVLSNAVEHESIICWALLRGNCPGFT